MKDYLLGALIGFILSTMMWAAFIGSAEKDMVKTGFTIVEKKLYHISEVTVK